MSLSNIVKISESWLAALVSNLTLAYNATAILQSYHFSKSSLSSVFRSLLK